MSTILKLETLPPGAFEIAEFAHHRATEPNHIQMSTFGALATWLDTPFIAETKEEVPLWSPVTYVPGTSRAREWPAAASIWRVHAGVFEVDHLPLHQLEPLVQRLASSGYEATIYSTHSHRSRDQRKCNGVEDAHIRIVLGFSRGVPGHLWDRVWRSLRDKLIPEADQQARDAKRLFYRYSYPESRAHLAVFRHLAPQGVSHAA
jgi:hypothetical protein